MSSFKKSLLVIVGLLVLIVAIATLLPRVGRGQESKLTAPPQLPMCGKPKFYLTKACFAGNEALTACAAGYHMASLWEIIDPSNLTYDLVRGHNNDDSGSGPPALYAGWVRTGYPKSNGSGPFQVAGVGNCNAWTTAESFYFGTQVQLHSEWREPGLRGDPWFADVVPCSSCKQVWCVQD
jgi:hypothetical protein